MKRIFFLLTLGIMLQFNADALPKLGMTMDPCVLKTSTGWQIDIGIQGYTCQQGNNSLFIRYWVYLGTFSNPVVIGPLTPTFISANKVRLVFTDPIILDALKNGQCIGLAGNIRCCANEETCSDLLLEPVFNGFDYGSPEERWNKLIQFVCPCSAESACISGFSICTSTYEISKNQFPPTPISYVELEDNDNNYLAGEVALLFEDCDPPGNNFPPYTKKLKVRDTWSTVNGVFAQSSYYLNTVQAGETFSSPPVIYQQQGNQLGAEICHTKSIEIVWMQLGLEVGGCKMFECQTCLEVCFGGLDMPINSNNQNDYLGTSENTTILSANQQLPGDNGEEHPEHGHAFPHNSDCIADWFVCSNTDNLNGNKIYTFDDIDLDYLIPDINAANANSPCISPLPWTCAVGARVTDVWDVQAFFNVIYTNSKDVYGIPTTQTLGFMPFTLAFSPIDQGALICHTKKIELICKDEKAANSSVYTRPYIECQVCMDMCMNSSESTINNSIWTTQNRGETAMNTSMTKSFDIKLYPNPTQDVVHLELQFVNKQNAIYQIFDVNGRVLMAFERSMDIGKNIIDINVKEFVPGMYSIMMKTNTESIPIGRFVKR